MAERREHIGNNSFLLLREKDAAQLLGVGYSTLKRWRQQHRVPYIDLRDLGAGHGVILYDPTVLVKWAQQYGVEPEE